MSGLKELSESAPSLVVGAIAAVFIGVGAIAGGGIIAGLIDNAQKTETVGAIRSIPLEPRTPEPDAPATTDAQGSAVANTAAPEKAAPQPAATDRPATQVTETIAPEAATELTPLSRDVSDLTAIEADDYMIAAAHPAAAQAGASVLRDGGSAVDAAIAAQLVLNLVEPQSSGIGGGGFMLHWDEHKRRLDTYDGRETAPLKIRPDSFLKADGTPKSYFDAVAGGASVGVPGLLRMLELAHQRHGNLPWKDLFQPAIDLAEKGFPISPRLNRLLGSVKGLKDMNAAAAYFYDADGNPKPVGTVLKNPAFAASLREIAEEGADAFYDGTIARNIVATVREASKNPGQMALIDMASYEAIHRPNLCHPYEDVLVCGMPPPSSGGLTVLQTLALLEHMDADLEDLDPYSPEAIAMISEASALAFADRNAYIADADFYDVPIRGMLAPAYLKARAGLADLSSDKKTKKPHGDPKNGAPVALDASLELPSTTHLSIVDADGNAISMTTSIETAFGSRLMVGGFLLNNQLTDFSWLAEKDGKPVANRIEPGKRPRSSMSPTLVFDEDRELMLVTGSPGGSRIIGYTVQSILNVVDWDMNAQQAVSAPHYVNRNGKTDLEADAGLDDLVPALEARGYTVGTRTLTSGLHMIEIDDDELEGGADPRREGAAVGEDQLLPSIDDSFTFIGNGS